MNKQKSIKTVTVSSGAYTTVRAAQRAKRLHGERAEVRGIIGKNYGSTYTYEVVLGTETTT